MKGHARLLAIIANVDTGFELLAHDRFDSRPNLPCEFSLVDRLATLLQE
jgi:hypothetical protein